MKSVEVDASKMLEAALQQMDGIISGTNASSALGNSSGTVSGSVSGVNSGGGIVGGSGGGGDAGIGAGGGAGIIRNSNTITANERSHISKSNILNAAKTLALALQEIGGTAPTPDAVTAAVIKDWLDLNGINEITDERMHRLHKEKENLALEYQKLAERVSEQADKIIELERLLTEKTQQLSNTEEQLQRELLARSAWQTEKLEFVSALSELKLHRAVLERENVELQIENGKENTLQYYNNGSINRNVPTAPKTPPASFRHQIHPQFHSLPRSYGAKNGLNHNKALNNNNNNNNKSVLDANANSNNTKQRNVAFASNEKILIDDIKTENDFMQSSFISQVNAARQSPILTKGFRNIFGKFKRSNSGNLELPDLNDCEFKRGGSRATTSGRIEWSTQSSQMSTLSKDYTDWTIEEIDNWLCDLGLGCYQEDCKKWLAGNPNVCFFTASPVDIEKELNLKSPLHRKKILLAIDELIGKENDVLALKAAHLDVSWVLRWLDDIGLPQYKDSFLDAKIDGRMLHRLTLEDLAHLHVYSCLHIASLHRGIQCMREMEWQPDCLIRRSTAKVVKAEQNDNQNESNNSNKQNNDSSNESTSSDNTNNEVKENIALWTAHRVMEWLRVADLSEYAPNLRGAGVHGALMIYENRFNANLLADLLSIPPTKSLLRRHLATQFKELLGRKVIHEKRDAEEAPGYQPLSLTAKIKPPKKLQFALIRRKSNKGNSDVEWSDYVCPMISFCSKNYEKSSSNDQENSNSSSNSTSLQST